MKKKIKKLEYECENCGGLMLMEDIGKHTWCKPRLSEFNLDYKEGYEDGLEKGIEIALRSKIIHSSK